MKAAAQGVLQIDQGIGCAMTVEAALAMDFGRQERWSREPVWREAQARYAEGQAKQIAALQHEEWTRLLKLAGASGETNRSVSGSGSTATEMRPDAGVSAAAAQFVRPDARGESDDRFHAACAGGGSGRFVFYLRHEFERAGGVERGAVGKAVAGAVPESGMSI